MNKKIEDKMKILDDEVGGWRQFGDHLTDKREVVVAFEIDGSDVESLKIPVRLFYAHISSGLVRVKIWAVHTYFATVLSAAEVQPSHVMLKKCVEFTGGDIFQLCEKILELSPAPKYE